VGFEQRVDCIALNYSLHTPTNGELWILSLLPDEPLVLDVGYNAGDFSGFARSSRINSRIIAFDPSRSAFQNFRRTCATDPGIVFENIALSNVTGEAEFHDYGNMSSSLAERMDQGSQAASVYRVPVWRLDDYARNHGISHIALLKIDAEGYDLHVLEGASELLDRQAIDIFMFEYANGWIASRRYLQDAVAYLKYKPYRLFRLFNGFLQPFVYTVAHERFDVGCMFVGVSQQYLSADKIPIRDIVGEGNP